jgi:hypothetical protein
MLVCQVFELRPILVFAVLDQRVTNNNTSSELYAVMPSAASTSAFLDAQHMPVIMHWNSDKLWARSTLLHSFRAAC